MYSHLNALPRLGLHYYTMCEKYDFLRYLYQVGEGGGREPDEQMHIIVENR